MQRRKASTKRTYVTEDTSSGSTFVTAPSGPRNVSRGPVLFDASQAEAEALAGNGTDSGFPDGSSSYLGAPPSGATSAYPSSSRPSNSHAYSYSQSSAMGYQPSWAQPTANGGLAGNVYVQAALGSASRAGRHAWAGIRDATKLGRSVDLVMGDAELRSNVLKSSIINLISLLSIFIFDHLLLPHSSSTLTSDRAISQAKRIGFWFDLIWKWPVFGFCFWMNTSWSATISKRALTLQHPTSRQGQSATAQTWANLPLWRKVFSVLPRLFVILDHFVVTVTLSYVPVVGRPLAFWYTCLLDAFYCFDFALSSKDWSFRMIARHIGDRTPYFAGFGLLPAVLCSFGPLLLGMTIFALIYPLMVIQAIQARPLPSIVDDDDSSYADNLASPSRDGSPLPSPGVVPGSGSYMSTPSSSYPSLSPVDGANPAAKKAYHRAGGVGIDDDLGFFGQMREWFLPHGTGMGRVPVFWAAVKLLDVSRWFERSMERRLRSSGMGNVMGSRRMESFKGYYGAGSGSPGNASPSGGYGAGYGTPVRGSAYGSGASGNYGAGNGGLTNRKVM